MRTAWILALLLSGCGAASRDASRPLVVGALPDASRTSLGDGVSPAPGSAVFLLYEGRFVCSGALVAPDVVVSAAHCFQRDLAPGKWLVGRGRDWDDPEVVLRPVTDIAVPRATTDAAGARVSDTRFFPFGDVAVLKLGGAPFAEGVPTPVLAGPDEALTDGAPLLLAGYGITRDTGRDFGVLRAAETRVGQYFPTGVNRGLVKVGPVPGTGACSGDSGGPLYVPTPQGWRLAGVTHGVDTTITPEILADPFQPCKAGVSVYTVLADHADWLRQVAPGAFPRRATTPAFDPAPRDLEASCARGRLEPEAARTVRALLIATGTSDCASLAAEARTATSLSLAWKDLRDLSPVAAFTALKRLDLSREPALDLAPLARLTSLEALDLSEMPLGPDALAPLAGLTALRELKMGYADAPATQTPPPSLAALAGKSALQTLVARNLGLEDLSPLAGSPALRTLDLVGNAVESVAPLAGAHALTTLYLNRNRVADVTPLAGLTGLVRLTLSRNLVTDPRPLAPLAALELLALGGNPIPAALRVCPVVEEFPGAVCSF